LKGQKSWGLRVAKGRDGEGKSDGFVPVLTPDVILMDGVIHLVDSVLLPEALSQNKKVSWLSRLTSGLGNSKLSIEHLTDLLGPYIDEF
jgi:hypothetical protein